MDLNKRHVADLLMVSEQAIDHFVKDNGMPHYFLGDDLRFNRGEVERWLMQFLVEDREGLFPFVESPVEKDPWQKFCLYRALHKGFVWANYGASSKRELIFSVLSKAAPYLSFDGDFVRDLFWEREILMPTSLGNGIAVPHARDFFLNGLFDIVIIVYPDQLIDWGGTDHSFIHSLFFLFACNDERHLQLMAKVAHFVNQRECVDLLKHRAMKSELLEFVKKWESSTAKDSLCTCQ